MKKTPWFDGSVKPCRVGVYERDFGSLVFSRWDGSWWYVYELSVDNAWKNTTPSTYQSLPWRGLAQD